MAVSASSASPASSVVSTTSRTPAAPAAAARPASSTVIEPVIRARVDGFERSPEGAKPAVFLDRDGVLNVTQGFLNRPEDVDAKLIPEALEAVAKLAKHGVPVFILTNQGGVQLGKMTPEVAEAINARVVERIEEAGGQVRAVYYCPRMDAPELAEGEVDARKPAPGMFFHAAAEHGDIDLSRSVMVGDMTTDLAAARNAGLGSAVLVRTGFGGKDGKVPDVTPDRTSKNLKTAVDWILSSKGPWRAEKTDGPRFSAAHVQAATDFVNAHAGKGLQVWGDVSPYDADYFPQFGQGNCGVAAALVGGEAAVDTLALAKQTFPRTFGGAEFDPSRHALVVVADSEDEVSLHLSRLDKASGEVTKLGTFGLVDAEMPEALEAQGIYDGYDFLKHRYGQGEDVVVLRTHETDHGVDLFDDVATKA